MTQPGPNELLAVNLSALAREVAMDVFPVADIIKMHRLSDEEWAKIQESTKFQQMLANMIAEWQSAANTKERLKVKAQTGLEMQLETFIFDMADGDIPLAQRVEAAKFLARIGELDGHVAGNALGSGFAITLNIGGEIVNAVPTIDLNATEIPDDRPAIPHPVDGR